MFVCQRRENSSSSNLIIVYISREFHIEFPAAHRYPRCNAQSKFALSRSPRCVFRKLCQVMFCCRHFYCVRIEPHCKHRSIEFLTTQTDQSKGNILIDYVLTVFYPFSKCKNLGGNMKTANKRE